MHYKLYTVDISTPSRNRGTITMHVTIYCTVTCTIKRHYVHRDFFCVSYIIAAFFERKCTLEMEKNAHSHSNAVSFAVTIFLSGQTGRELCLFKNLK